MSILIAGHQRSGTTLLKDLCNSHPQVAVTGEFGNYMLLDEPYPVYARFIWGRWWKKRNAAILEPHPLKGVDMARNLGFTLRYLAALRMELRGGPGRVVDAGVIDAGLRRLFPGKSLVGDKYPDHIFRMSKLSRDERLKCIFIYRDPRDVAASTLKRARSELRSTWPDEMRDPKEIAERWVQTIEMMERSRERVLAIRYEELVTWPRPVLDRLGEWLGIDPSGFDAGIVRPTSIGKHRQSLTEGEIHQVESIAGPVMRSLGYAV